MTKYVVPVLRIANGALWFALTAAFIANSPRIGRDFAYVLGQLVGIAMFTGLPWFALDRCIVKSAHQITKALAD